MLLTLLIVQKILKALKNYFILSSSKVNKCVMLTIFGHRRPP